jgi:D-3-phosphoglycerate dehydrogenase / 2-oxoglutarate reductase
VRIVATADVPPVAHEAFSPLGDIVVDGGDASLAGAEILIVRGTVLDEPLLERAHRLRAIARTGAGYDNVDVAAATRRGIPIVYAPGVGSQPVAEGAVALILAAAKRLRELGAVIEQESWPARYGVMGLDLDGACLGLVGLGAIGTRVARLCGGLGMSVIACDPAAGGDCPAGVELVTLPELAERADVISLHCALTDETRGLVDRALLAKVRRGAILVNVARGEVVESEEVLADALEEGVLSAIALDVFPTEPPEPSHRLYADPRVICTPHAVGLTGRWNREVFMTLAEGVANVLGGGLPPTLLNPDALRQR